VRMRAAVVADDENVVLVLAGILKQRAGRNHDRIGSARHLNADFDGRTGFLRFFGSRRNPCASPK